MVARGYRVDSIKFHLSAMANRSRSMEYKPYNQFSVSLVSTLHPATTVLSHMARNSVSETSNFDSLLQLLIPKSSLLVTYRKLPNLQLLLCRNEQNQLATKSSSPLDTLTMAVGAFSVKPPHSPSLFTPLQCLDTVSKFPCQHPVNLALP